jgi:peptidoglycan/LPS O-acetylase OafA/YrhL
MGALVAALMHENPKKVPSVIRTCGLVALPLWAASLYIDRGRTPRFGFDEIVVVRDVTIALLYGWVVSAASVGVPGSIGTFLQSRPLVWVGRISYAIYVFHVFIWHLSRNIVPESWGWWAPRIITIALTLAVAGLSWRIYEGPINGLKRRFPYPSSNA